MFTRTHTIFLKNNTVLRTAVRKKFTLPRKEITVIVFRNDKSAISKIKMSKHYIYTYFYFLEFCIRFLSTYILEIWFLILTVSFLKYHRVFFYIKFYFLAWWCFFSNSRWWDGAGTPRCSFGQLCVDDCTTRAKVRIACKLIIYSSSSWKAADYNRIYIVLWHIRMRLVVVVCTYIPMYKSRGTGQQCCR